MKEEDFSSITWNLNRWADIKTASEQYSPVHRINGFPWRLRLYKFGDEVNDAHLALLCEKSSEAELWECTATIKTGTISHTHTFTSWNVDSQQCLLESRAFYGDDSISVKIAMNDDGENWRLRPTLDPLEQRDGVLAVGDKKVYVNKESLASQSPFFDRLFNGDFVEKKMAEIPIGDVEYEEFSNIIRMIYGFNGASLSDDNVSRVAQLADRFELKIVADRVISFLLSSSSKLSIHQKLLISDQYNLPILKVHLLPMYNSKNVILELCDSADSDHLSPDTFKYLLKKSCNL